MYCWPRPCFVWPISRSYCSLHRIPLRHHRHPIPHQQPFHSLHHQITPPYTPKRTHVSSHLSPLPPMQASLAPQARNPLPRRLQPPAPYLPPAQQPNHPHRPAPRTRALRHLSRSRAVPHLQLLHSATAEFSSGRAGGELASGCAGAVSYTHLTLPTKA